MSETPYAPIDGSRKGLSLLGKLAIFGTLALVALTIALVVVFVIDGDNKNESDSPGYTSLSQAQVDELTSKIQDIIYQNPNNNIPKMVRLSFHDCIGGCNGCLNLLSAGGTDAGNNGLDYIVDLLEPTYQNYSSVLSRADFWALAGHVAVLEGSKQQGSPYVAPNITYLWGRHDCPGSPYENNRLVGLPDASRNISEVYRVFVDGLGLTIHQATALIGGGHSLGQCHAENSGFRGPWKLPVATFNNAFFSELIKTSRNWTQVLLDTNQYQWNNSDTPAIMMLNTDMSFYKSIDPDTAGAVSCSYAACTASETASYVEQYANDINLFMADFAPAWDIMLSQAPTSTTEPGSKLVSLYKVGQEIDD